MPDNHLYYGDNLDILRRNIEFQLNRKQMLAHAC
jgi:hypothetical protein